MAGEFEGPDKEPFVLVVNKSLQQSAQLSVQFKEPGRIQFVSPYTGRMQDLRGEHDWLAPGQGVLLGLVK